MDASPVRAELAGAVVLAWAGLLTVGGAAASPGGMLLGIAGWAPASAVMLAAAGLLALAVRRGVRLLPALALLPFVLLLTLGIPVPGVKALSGWALCPLVLAAVVAGLALARPAWARPLFFPLVVVFYMAVASRVQVQVGPNGDEPHYLMVADSLWRDHDLGLESDYAQGRYRAFYDRPLAPHYRVRGKTGEIYSLHAIGLSLLILPAYVAGGYPAASFFMALLAALLALEIRGLVRAWTDSDALALGCGAFVAFSPPLVHYAGLIFTEVPAALIVAATLRRGTGGLHPRKALLLGAAVAFLPWLNVRYAPLAMILVVFLLSTRPGLRATAALVVPSLASAIGVALYHFVLYGFFDPRRVYGRRPELSLGIVPEGLPGLLLDQEFGLLAYAPVFALALPGFFQLWRKDARRGVSALALVAVVLGTASTWPMWRGGFNPPARFLVPVIPVLAVAAAARLSRGLNAGAALLIGWGLWTGLGGALEPRLVHRDRDGTAPFFRAYAGAREWTALLPGYVLADPDRHRLSLLWTAALLAAVGVRPKAVTMARLSLASAGLLAAAAVASSVSRARTEDRDAVRVVGRPAVEVPGWKWRSVAPAVWGPETLDWGPAYEPHRYPAGVEIGRRLPLPAGLYRVVIEGEDLDPGTPPGVLEARPDGLLRGERTDLRREGGFRTGEFSVAARSTPVTLLLQGGGPLLLKRMDLQVQPWHVSAGLTRVEWERIRPPLELDPALTPP
jgi:hypothetical protein